MPNNTKWSSRKTLGYSVFSFSDLDSAWPNYENSPIFISRDKAKSLNLFFSVTATLWHTHARTHTRVVKSNKSCYPRRLNDMTIWKIQQHENPNMPQCYFIHIFSTLFIFSVVYYNYSYCHTFAFIFSHLWWKTHSLLASRLCMVRDIQLFALCTCCAML